MKLNQTPLTTKQTTEDLYECLRCNKRSANEDDGMCPCPRNSCEAFLAGKIITIVKVFKKENYETDIIKKISTKLTETLNLNILISNKGEEFEHVYRIIVNKIKTKLTITTMTLHRWNDDIEENLIEQIKKEIL